LRTIFVSRLGAIRTRNAILITEINRDNQTNKMKTNYDLRFHDVLIRQVAHEFI